MKKLLFVLVSICLLCGCENNQPQYLISSMGFDYSKGEYQVCYEAIVINSENTDQTLKLIEGRGDSVKEAVDEIKKQSTQSLLLSHCGVVAIDEQMPNIQFGEVCEFCYGQEELTLSAFFVRSENVKKLLSTKPVSSACAGYDIMGLLKQNKQFKNRFFEVINLGYDSVLPTVNQKDGGLYFEN